MGRDLSGTFKVAKEIFEAADDILGFDLTSICFQGPEEKLRQTRYTQPAILVHSVAVWRIIEERGFKPDFVAGHSVGEYSALVASRALAFPDALRLVRVRAEAMHSCGIERPGAMAAIIGMPEANLSGLLGESGKAGIIEPANFNSPVQVVISGEVAAIEKAVEVARSHGAKRAMKLNVSGAFHSPLMKMAEERLAAALSSVSFSRAAIPLVSNVEATAVTEPDRIVNLLERQLTSPVLWKQSMRHILDSGVSRFVEVGPGNVLCGLLKRIDAEVKCLSCSDVKNIESFFEEVRV
jgi:[acyl-carrier-protein] S-malonyltransferase